MRETEGEVECHIIGIVKSRKNAEVGYMSGVYDKTGNGPWFEGSMRGGGLLRSGGRGGWSETRVCVEVERSNGDRIQRVHNRRCCREIVQFLGPWYI